jgi:hypothetical protein
MMRVIRAHVEAALLRGVAGAARLDAGDREKPIMVVEEIRSRDWASATFVGALVSMELRLEGQTAAVETAMAELGARLPDWEFRIPGQIVAEIGLMPAAHDTGSADSLAAGSGRVPNLGPSTVSRLFVIEALTILD